MDPEVALIRTDSSLPTETLRALRDRLRAELVDSLELAEALFGADPARAARARTLRDLIDDLLALAPSSSERLDRERLRLEANLLYDGSILAGEYYKQFLRPPTPEHPAGRI